MAEGEMIKHLSILCLVWFGHQASGLAQCVPDPIRVDRIEGYVLFGFQKEFRVLDKAEIRVLDPGRSHAIIGSAAVDKNGHFEMTGVRPGKYLLSARSEALIPASVDVEVTTPNHAPGRRMILVTLAADATQECGGTSIQVRPTAEVDRVVRAAKRPIH
jgi:hypothetical protein